MIRFGSMSIALLLGALYGVMRATMLWWAEPNRPANRLLALLLLALCLFTLPYIIGYAGYYDAYPWLSFFPYDYTLAFGPLLWCYHNALLAGGARLPPRWGWHFLPAAAQLLYYGWLFCQPLAFKNRWDTLVEQPYVGPIAAVAALTSLAAYWALAWRRHAAFSLAAPADPRREWGRNLLVAFGLTIAFRSALLGAEWLWSGLDYFQRFPFYMWLAVLVCYLGTEGYRHGIVHYHAAELAPRAAVTALQADCVAQAECLTQADCVTQAECMTQAQCLTQAETAPKPARSQADIGQRWRDEIAAQQWWREPDLTLAALARRLGTNSSSLSRAINEGLGLNLNELLNRMRVDAVIAAMRQADAATPVLDIAFAEGFSSKASFNRAFKLYTGATPSDYRRALLTAGPVSHPAPGIES